MSAAAMARRKPRCETCGYIHASDWARAIGLLTSPVVTYRATTMPDAPRRATRAEAVADECAWRAAR